MHHSDEQDPAQDIRVGEIDLRGLDVGTLQLDAIVVVPRDDAVCQQRQSARVEVDPARAVAGHRHVVEVGRAVEAVVAAPGDRGIAGDHDVVEQGVREPGIDAAAEVVRLVLEDPEIPEDRVGAKQVDAAAVPAGPGRLREAVGDREALDDRRSGDGVRSLEADDARCPGAVDDRLRRPGPDEMDGVDRRPHDVFAVAARRDLDDVARRRQQRAEQHDPRESPCDLRHARRPPDCLLRLTIVCVRFAGV